MSDPTAAGPKSALRRAFLGGACLSLQPLLLSALMLPATAYVIRRLGPTAYGQWATATALVAVITFITNLGLRGAYVRTVARHPESAEHAFAEQMGARITLAVLAAVLAVGLSLALHYPAVVLACTGISSLGIVLLVVSTTAADTLQALHRLPVVAGVNMAAGVCLTGLSIGVVALGGGPVAVAGSYLSGTAVSSVLLLSVLRKQHFRPHVRWNPRRCAVLVWNARFLGTQQLVFSLSQNAEGLLIPRLVGTTLFGYFSAGALLANRLTAVPEGLCSAAYPAMVNAHRHGARAVLPVFLRFLGLVVFACVCGAAAIQFVAPWIARLLFPRQPEISEQVMRITIWLLPAMGLHFIVGYLFNALDMDAEQTRATFVGSIVGLAMTAVLVWRFGITGACWSMVLRYVIHLVTHAYYYPRIFRLMFPKTTPDVPLSIESAAEGALVR